MKDYEPPEETISDKKSSKASAKKKKAKKDPNAPKRGKSSFMFFSNEVRAQIKADNPDLSFGDLGRTIGSKFKALEADEKKKYESKREECADKTTSDDIDLDMRIRIVDGDEVLADTSKEGSFLASCKVFEEYVKKRYAKKE